MRQLNCNMLTKLLEKHSISPDSTDPAGLKLIEREEWLERRPGSLPPCPPSVPTPRDIYPLLSDGTSSPLPVERREDLFRRMEIALNAPAAPEFRPQPLPEDLTSVVR
jgi:hypothetical protein